MLADNEQMTGSLHKGANFKAQGDRHAVQYFITLSGHLLLYWENNWDRSLTILLTFVILVLFRNMNFILWKNHFVDVCALAA